jgi:hypothetical protein
MICCRQRLYFAYAAVYAVVLGALFVLYSSASAGQYVRVSPDLELYYEEAGSGTPLIFIPG